MSDITVSLKDGSKLVGQCYCLDKISKTLVLSKLLDIYIYCDIFVNLPSFYTIFVEIGLNYKVIMGNQILKIEGITESNINACVKNAALLGKHLE